MRLLTPDERRDLGMKIARSMCPRTWEEFDSSPEELTNQDVWEMDESIRKAKSVLEVLGVEELIGKVANYDELKASQEAVE